MQAYIFKASQKKTLEHVVYILGTSPRGDCINTYIYNIYNTGSYRYVLLQSSLFHVISLMLNCHVCRVSPVKTRVNKPTNWGEPPVLQAGAPQF